MNLTVFATQLLCLGGIGMNVYRLARLDTFPTGTTFLDRRARGIRFRRGTREQCKRRAVGHVAAWTLALVGLDYIFFILPK
jgi:hypothetical protein